MNGRTLRLGTDCSGLETICIALQLIKANVIHRWACECEPALAAYIKNHYKPERFYNNIFNRNHSDLPFVDLYVAGFPCISFSGIGKQNGFNSSTGTIFFEVMKTIQCVKPSYFILENVKSIITVSKGTVFKTIQEHISKLNDYNVYYEVLNTQDYGIPQCRPRLYIIGIKKSFQKSFTMIKPIIQLPYINEFLDKSDVGQRQSLSIRHNKHIDIALQKHNGNQNDDWIITVDNNGSFVNCKKDITPCITTHCRYYYISSLQRFLTIKELLLLQGFPNDFHLPLKSKVYTYIGNAMSCNVLYYILASLFCI